LSGLVVAVAIAGAPVQATAQAVPPGARLQGVFAMSGHVTDAFNVRGERTGQRVQRSWQFTPLCPRGACAAITLLRTRVGGSDRLTLRRRAPHFYSGSGIFFAPLTCARRYYATGEEVPFTISVRVTAGTVTSAGAFVTAIRATYVNRSRINLTPCVAVLGHDAASYRGVPAVAPAPSGGGTAAGA
jgi:hypothetical protein